jgi:hypothetical protein
MVLYVPSHTTVHIAPERLPFDLDERSWLLLVEDTVLYYTPLKRVLYH